MLKWCYAYLSNPRLDWYRLRVCCWHGHSTHWYARTRCLISIKNGFWWWLQFLVLSNIPFSATWEVFTWIKRYGNLRLETFFPWKKQPTWSIRNSRDKIASRTTIECYTWPFTTRWSWDQPFYKISYFKRRRCLRDRKGRTLSIIATHTRRLGDSCRGDIIKNGGMYEKRWSNWKV